MKALLMLLIPLSLLAVEPAPRILSAAPYESRSKLTAVEAQALEAMNARIGAIESEARGMIGGIVEGRNALITSICKDAGIEIGECEVRSETREIKRRPKPVAKPEPPKQ